LSVISGASCAKADDIAASHMAVTSRPIRSGGFVELPAWPHLPGNEKPIVRPCWLGTVQTHRPYPVKGAANLSLSIFTIGVDGKPVLAFGARRYSEAQAICTDEQLRTKLSSLKSDTVPLCGDDAILRVRLAHPKEAARYRQATSQSTVVYLVKLDGPEDL
jgi:hypothetical protein